MQSSELKNMQAPLKEKYRTEPEAAMITMRANGQLGEGISCKIETGKALAEAGLHPASGGDGMLVCSGDMLLEALVGCAGVTMQAVATSIGIELKEGKITAEGDIDFRGTLAVSKEVPVGFKAIRLKFNLTTNAGEDQVKTLGKLTERYCIVYQTLTKGVPVTTEYISNK
jgi:uncharacterized OsmC-like protein